MCSSKREIVQVHQFCNQSFVVQYVDQNLRVGISVMGLASMEKAKDSKGVNWLDCLGERHGRMGVRRRVVRRLVRWAEEEKKMGSK
jgi:hypothetical protein